jgi:predicted unusual protein kinase regulating ubiquinone biosynthesis (AarF/ABC1/UbiB family)
MLRARYRQILFFFARLLLNLLIWDVVLPRLGLRGLSRRTRPLRLRRSAADFRRQAVRMGGVLIKVGQFFSARVDVLPDEITSELAGLQDEVAPERFEDIRGLIETELGSTLGDAFVTFNEKPLASASLGQVHRAEIKADGVNGDTITDIVVKVQRPDIEVIIATDLAALRRVGGWLQRYPPIRRRADVPALVQEFTHILYEEIDYLAEGRNAETFAATFADHPEVRVPEVIWTHTTRRVLSLEDVYAIKITDYGEIAAAGVDRAEVADRLFRIYLQQIFEDGFFHADPHPGNLFVHPFPAEEGDSIVRWELTFVDFGMVGRVPPHLRAGLRELAIAVGTRDPRRMITAFQMMGVLLPEADLELLERAEERALEQFWGKSMSELADISYHEMREIALEYRDLLYQMPFQIPQNLILLGRTVGILSGMCTGLNPDFNFWDGMAPFARKLLADEMSEGWERWLGEVGEVVRTVWALPSRAEALLTKMEKDGLRVRAPDVNEGMGRLERSANRLLGGVIFAALLITGVQLYLNGDLLPGGGLLFGALITFLLTLLSGRRR